MKSLQNFITIRDGNTTIADLPVSSEQVAEAVREIDDVTDNAPMFELLASHPSALVREEVVLKNCLNEATVMQLAADPSVTVLYWLAGNEAFEKFGTDAEVMALIDSDTEVAKAVAECFERYERIDQQLILRGLLDLGDMAVIAVLANRHLLPEAELLKYGQILKSEQINHPLEFSMMSDR